MGPAGTAVLGNVLVADVGEIVSSVNVVPDPGFRDLVSWNQGRLDQGLEIL